MRVASFGEVIPLGTWLHVRLRLSFISPMELGTFFVGLSPH